MTELIAIPFSHFCEKARWGLQRSGVLFQERAVLPTLHQPVVWWALRGSAAGAADAHSSRFSTPVLVTNAGPISGSTEILRYADASLFGDPEVARWVERFDETLGPHTRRIGYFWAFGTKDVLVEIAKANSGWFQTTAVRLGQGLLVPWMRKMMRIDTAGFERSLGRVHEVMDEVAEALSQGQRNQGQRYLVGDSFSAADLTFAALLAPVVLPPEYGATLPARERFDERTQALIDRLREHPAGEFALRLYREERQAGQVSVEEKARRALSNDPAPTR